MALVAALPVGAAGVYLLVLGIAALGRPARVTAYLGGFAETLQAHLLELSIRIVVGVSLIGTAPGMHLPSAFRALGWVLVGTSLLLLILPWRWHRRFARWSVPQATASLPLFGAASVLAGAVLLWALRGPVA